MLSNTLGFRSIFIVAAFLLSAIAANAQPPQRLMSKLDARLSSSVRARHSDTKRVIIRTTSDGIPRLTNALNGNRRFVRRLHSTINALTAHVPVAELESLSKLPFVESISEDAIVRAEQTPSDGSTLRGTLGLPLQSPSGYGVGVAVIDSGLEDGPEFAGRVYGFYDFTTDGGEPTAPTDGYGHGTHVAGLIAGNGVLSDERYRGVAPKARLIVLKVLDENGRATPAT